MEKVRNTDPRAPGMDIPREPSADLGARAVQETVHPQCPTGIGGLVLRDWSPDHDLTQWEAEEGPHHLHFGFILDQ